jgi:hypothetical protein
MTKTEFAALLKITVRRVNQLIAEGLIVLDAGEVDPIPSLVALLAEEKTRSTTNEARSRLTEMQIRGAELRSQRALKKLITVEELEQILGIHLGQCFNLAQALSTGAFHNLAAKIGEDDARSTAHAVHQAILELAHRERRAVTELCARIRTEELPEKARVAKVFSDLLVTHD